MKFTKEALINRLQLKEYPRSATYDPELGYYARFVKPGGQIGIVVPGLKNELEQGLPDHLAEYWDWEYWSFHSPAWWQRHWEKTGKVDVKHADLLSNGWQQWLLWEQVCSEGGYRFDPKELKMLEIDAGRNLGFTRLLGNRW
jgi:hypothetical protein